MQDKLQLKIKKYLKENLPKKEVKVFFICAHLDHQIRDQDAYRELKNLGYDLQDVGKGLGEMIIVPKKEDLEPKVKTESFTKKTYKKWLNSKFSQSY